VSPQLQQLPQRLTNLRVVPANAGTHKHSHPSLREVSTSASIEGPRRMGPGVRRDDVWMVLREGGK